MLSYVPDNVIRDAVIFVAEDVSHPADQSP
jgi:hypothetical protein